MRFPSFRPCLSLCQLTEGENPETSDEKTNRWWWRWSGSPALLRPPRPSLSPLLAWVWVGNPGQISPAAMLEQQCLRESQGTPCEKSFLVFFYFQNGARESNLCNRKSAEEPVIGAQFRSQFSEINNSGILPRLIPGNGGPHLTETENIKNSNPDI